MEQVKISKNSLDVKAYILKHLNDLEYNAIKVIIDVIRLQNERDNLGAEMDKTMWLDLLDELEKTLKTRKEQNND